MHRAFVRPPLDAEHKLVLAATSPEPVSPDIDSQMDRVDASVTLGVARRNKVVPHVARLITENQAHVGNDRWSDLLVLAKQYAHRSAVQHRETIEVLREFRALGIAACPIKGTFLSETLYGDPTRRQASDIDLLVQPSDFAGAIEALRRRGYTHLRPRSLPKQEQLRRLLNESRHYEVAVIDEQRRLCIELHWRFTSFRRFPGEQDDRLFDRFVTRDFSGFETPCMTEHDLLLYMALHGTKDYWRRLSWLADFTRLASMHPLAVSRARELAAEHQLLVVWESTCALADLWYNTSLYVPPASQMQRERVRFIVDHVWLLRTPFSSTPARVLAYDWNARDSMRDSLRQAIAELVTPNYASAETEAEYDPGLQRRRRVVRVLRKVLRGQAAGT